nr:hypothetical protein [Tanacetum cinerariifolium]
MAPKRTTATTITSVTDAQLKALIDQGIVDALAEHDAYRSRSGDDSHDSRTGELWVLLSGLKRWNLYFISTTAQSHKTLKKMMTDKYCPRGEIKKLEIEMWNMKVKGTDVCTVKCANCKRVGHLTRDCRSLATTNNHRNLTCYKCGNQGHYRSDCQELKNLNHGNQARGTEARGMVHALGGGETNQDLNNMENDINA